MANNDATNSKNNKKGSVRNYLICFILLFVVTLVTAIAASNMEKKEDIKYEDFLEMVKDNKIQKIKWSEKNDTVTFYGTNKKAYKTENPKYEDFKKDMLMHGIEVKESNGIEKYETPIMMVFQVVMYMALFGAMLKISGMGSNIFSKKEKNSTSDVTFDDVAGLDEVKEDLMSVVDFLKNPKRYKDAGAEIPKGVLLYGPPGTGKTLLAKAVAGEAGVTFIAASGSDFDEKYVGVGASKMRKLFDEAKQNAPCIIFIDEIDSLGGKRHSKQSNYDRQTLNTLLSEMDGFDGSNGVVVIAATNRIEDLDSALTRPGRFDNHFAVSLPETAKERAVIINLYSKNKKFADDVDMENFAKETLGCSPATIKTVLNEAAIIATRRSDGIINREILDEAWLKQLMEGHLKKNHEKDNIDLIAWHEAGHALAGILLNQDLTKASIIPSTSGAGGATFITPKKMGLFSKKELEDQIVMLYAGRNAEVILAEEDNHVTTGASNDIEKATELIRKMVTEYGMTEKFGLLNLDILDENPELIMKEMIKISDELRVRSLIMLQNHQRELKAIAEALIEKETLTGKEMREIANTGE